MSTEGKPVLYQDTKTRLSKRVVYYLLSEKKKEGFYRVRGK
jgi:hypothetical protein